jgi:inorganic triphosphatase YgiF
MPIIVQHARNRGIFYRLETVHYDTSERVLFQCGMSLRVRRSGKHFIQTLKFLPEIGRPLKRRQWKVPVGGITPDLAQLPAAEIGDPVTTLAQDALVPVFATKVRRQRGSSICLMRRFKSCSTRGPSRPVRVKTSCPRSSSN